MLFILATGKHVSNLANVASGYHKVIEENRKLYNEVQDLKGVLVKYSLSSSNTGSILHALKL